MVLYSHNFYQIYCTSKKKDFYFFFLSFSSSSETLSSESLLSSLQFPFSKPVNAIYRENVEILISLKYKCLGYPEYEDCPHHVEKLQDYQEAVEDVVGGEHIYVSLSGVDGGVQDTGWE